MCFLRNLAPCDTSPPITPNSKIPNSIIKRIPIPKISSTLFTYFMPPCKINLIVRRYSDFIYRMQICRTLYVLRGVSVFVLQYIRIWFCVYDKVENLLEMWDNIAAAATKTTIVASFHYPHNEPRRNIAFQRQRNYTQICSYTLKIYTRPLYNAFLQQAYGQYFRINNIFRVQLCGNTRGLSYAMHTIELIIIIIIIIIILGRDTVRQVNVNCLCLHKKCFFFLRLFVD